MLEAVVIRCDRCGSHVAGLRGDTFTSGFYDVSGEPWSRYADEGERIICDPCLQDDPRYQADYTTGIRTEDLSAKEARRVRDEARRQAEKEQRAAARARWLKDHGDT